MGTYTFYNSDRDMKPFIYRFDSFINATGLRDHIIKKKPTDVYNGAVYAMSFIGLSYEERRQIKQASHELQFDIDMDLYAKYRDCCGAEKKVCNECWGMLVETAQLIDTVLMKDFNFKGILWTFSGGRGAHCRVFDYTATLFNTKWRREIIEYMK